MSILKARWLGLIPKDHLAQNPFAHAEGIFVIDPYDSELDLNVQLDHWRAQLSRHSIVLVPYEGPLHEILNRYPDLFQFHVGQTSDSNAIHEILYTEGVLYTHEGSCQIDTLGQGLLIWQKTCLERHKGVWAWPKAWLKSVLLLTLGFLIPFLWFRSWEMNSSPQTSPALTAKQLLVDSVEWTSTDLFSFRRQYRAAVFAMGYSPFDANALQKSGDKYLRSQGLNDQTHFKPALQVRLSKPVPDLKSLPRETAKAYHFFASLALDSNAVPSDFYQPQASATHRQHDGIDLAARLGTRLVAPYGGRVWTWENARAGKVAAIVKPPYVFLFAHCDKILFFNGDSVRKGDGVATVGMTGHTTGPHAHLAVGKLSGKWQNNHRPQFQLISPLEWYAQFQKSNYH